MDSTQCRCCYGSACTYEPPVVADPAPTPVALLSQEVRHYGCADPIRGIVGAVDHKEVSSVYGA